MNTKKVYALLLTVLIVIYIYIYLFPEKPVAKSRVYLIMNSVILSPPPSKYVTKSRVHFTIDGTVCGTVPHGAVCLMVWFMLTYSLLLVLILKYRSDCVLYLQVLFCSDLTPENDCLWGCLNDIFL